MDGLVASWMCPGPAQGARCCLGAGPQPPLCGGRRTFRPATSSRKIPTEQQPVCPQSLTHLLSSPQGSSLQQDPGDPARRLPEAEEPQHLVSQALWPEGTAHTGSLHIRVLAHPRSSHTHGPRTPPVLTQVLAHPWPEGMAHPRSSHTSGSRTPAILSHLGPHTSHTRVLSHLWFSHTCDLLTPVALTHSQSSHTWVFAHPGPLTPWLRARRGPLSPGWGRCQPQRRQLL